MKPAVEVDGLVRRFGAVTALAGVSFSVEPGTVFGIVGPDGSGKTTCLRLLSTVLTPTSGHARVMGWDTVESPWEVKDRIGYMSQQFGLYGDLTVEENIAFFADLFSVPTRERRERMTRLLEFSGMDPFLNRRSERLSGGMKQKLALMCALVHTPEVLLLDEPTNGVDPVSRREFWRILYGLVNEGLTVVVSTSYLDEAERCGVVALFNGGRIASIGTPSEVRSSAGLSLIEVVTPTPREAAAFIGNRLAGAMAEPLGDRIRVSIVSGTAGDVVRLLEEGGIAFSSVVSVEPSLEDVLTHGRGGFDDA